MTFVRECACVRVLVEASSTDSRLLDDVNVAPSLSLALTLTRFTPNGGRLLLLMLLLLVLMMLE